ncbi:MAG: GlsB/YeaQ/YmgE family stress response membrane protein [Verrucomicrobiales bacterium]
MAGLIIGLFPGEKGAGRFRNIVVGILGAILGSFVYKQFLNEVVNLNLPSLTLDLDQVVIALIGAVLLLIIIRFVKR